MTDGWEEGVRVKASCVREKHVKQRTWAVCLHGGSSAVCWVEVPTGGGLEKAVPWN